MVCVHTDVNVVDAVLFKNSHVNGVVRFMLEIPKNNLKRMGQHFQYVAPEDINNNSSDSFASNFAKHLIQKTSLQ